MLRIIKVSLFLVMTVSLCYNAYGQALEEYQVKTLFLYQFTKYINWPDGANTIVIGVLSDSPTALNTFKTLANKKSTNSRKIVVEEYNSEQPKKYNILYVTKNRSGLLSKLAKAISGEAILIISEKEGMIHKGSGINFVDIGGKLKFQMNKKAIKNAGLEVSSHLVNLAIVV